MIIWGQVEDLVTIWLVLRGHFGPIQGPPLKIERATQLLKILDGAQVTQLALVEKNSYT